jgi:hypothetical protein
MNPFLVFLIAVPFVAAVIFAVMLVATLIEKGFLIDYAVGILLLGSISIYLGKLLWKNLSVQAGMLEFPGGEHVGELERKQLGNLYLFIAYVVIGVAGVVLFTYETVKGIFGALGFLMGTTLLISGVAIYRSGRYIQGSLDYRLARSWYPRNSTLYLVIMSVIGSLIYLMFRFLPNWKTVSHLDVAGVIYLLLSTCVWLFLTDRRSKREKVS